MTKKNKRKTIDIAMDNLRKNGVRKEDTLEYLIDQGRTTHKTPLTTEERKLLRKKEITRRSVATRNEVTRMYIKHFSKVSVKGIDGDNLGEILIDCFDNGWLNTSKCFNKVSECFNVDRKTAKWISYVITKQAMTFTNWEFAMDRGDVSFSISAKDSNEYDGQEFPIMDLPKYVGFIVENYGSTSFHRDPKKHEELKKHIQVVKG